jgi:hypothetical protein
MVFLGPSVWLSPSPTLLEQAGGTSGNLGFSSGDCSLDTDADLTVGVLIGLGDALSGIDGLADTVIAPVPALVTGYRLPH